MESNISVVLSLYSYTTISSMVNSIKSVLNQSVPVKEIIVVDESYRRDFCVEIQNMCCEIISIKYIAKDNQERMVSNKIIGARIAVYEWLAFLNSDDVWLTNKIEKQLEELKQQEYNSNTIIISDSYIGYVNDDVPGLVYTNLDYFPVDFSKQDAHHRAYFYFFPHIISGLIVSKAYFMNVLDREDYDDWTLFLKLIRYAMIKHLHRRYYIRKVYLSKADHYDKDMVRSNILYLEKRRDDFSTIFGKTYYDKALRLLYKKASELKLEDVMEKIVGLLGNEDKLTSTNESHELENFIASHSSIACYGAGNFGSRITEYIKDMPEGIECVIVSDGQEHPNNLNGFPVKEFSDVNLDEMDGIILAMDMILYPDMKVKLQTNYTGDIFTMTYEGVMELKKGGVRHEFTGNP